MSLSTDVLVNCDRCNNPFAVLPVHIHSFGWDRSYCTIECRNADSKMMRDSYDALSDDTKHQTECDWCLNVRESFWRTVTPPYVVMNSDESKIGVHCGMAMCNTNAVKCYKCDRTDVQKCPNDWHYACASKGYVCPEHRYHYCEGCKQTFCGGWCEEDTHCIDGLNEE